MASAGGNGVYWVSASVTLLSTSMIVYLAMIYHPEKTNHIDLLKRLNEEAACALCNTNQNYPGDEQSHCSKCVIPISTPLSTTGCTLTSAQDDDLKKIVVKKMQSTYSESMKRYIQTVKNSHKHVLRKVQWIDGKKKSPFVHIYINSNSDAGKSSISHCAKSVGSRNELQTAGESVYCYRSDKLPVHGWYDVHIQFVITPQESFSIVLSTLTNSGSKHTLLKRDVVGEGVTTPISTDQLKSYISAHGLYTIYKGERLELTIRMPKHAKFSPEAGISHLSALFLRGID